jgi:hypothetical protein
LPLNDVQKQALLEELIKARSDEAAVDNSSGRWLSLLNRVRFFESFRKMSTTDSGVRLAAV